MENMKNIIFEAIATALFSAIVSTFVFLISELLTSEEIGVFISDSNKINDEYITIINIKNYQMSDNINKLEFYIESDIIKVNSELEFEELENKVIVENIYPSYNGSIMVITSQKIEETNLSIYCSNKCNVEWINNSKSFLDKIKYNTMIFCFVTFIMTFISNLYMRNIYNKSEKISDEKCKLMDKEIEYSKEKMKEINSSIKECKKENITLRKYMLSTIAQYAKELSFWKDTIRKTFCKNKKDLKTMEDFFEFVTINLKTYKTLEKCKYSNIEFILSEKEKEVSE